LASSVARRGEEQSWRLDSFEDARAFARYLELVMFFIILIVLDDDGQC